MFYGTSNEITMTDSWLGWTGVLKVLQPQYCQVELVVAAASLAQMVRFCPIATSGGGLDALHALWRFQDAQEQERKRTKRDNVGEVVMVNAPEVRPLAPHALFYEPRLQRGSPLFVPGVTR